MKRASREQAEVKEVKQKKVMERGQAKEGIRGQAEEGKHWQAACRRGQAEEVKQGGQAEIQGNKNDHNIIKHGKTFKKHSGLIPRTYSNLLDCLVV
jgi:hypothetical protein